MLILLEKYIIARKTTRHNVIIRANIKKFSIFQDESDCSDYVSKNNTLP